MSERADDTVEHDAAMIENLLELGRSFLALMPGQKRFCTQVYRIKRPCAPQLYRCGGLKNLNGFARVIPAYFDGCPDAGQPIVIEEVIVGIPLRKIVCHPSRPDVVACARQGESARNLRIALRGQGQRGLRLPASLGTVSEFCFPEGQVRLPARGGSFLAVAAGRIDGAAGKFASLAVSAVVSLGIGGQGQ